MEYHGLPIAITVEADTWSSYGGGIFPASSCNEADSDLNHNVQVIFLFMIHIYIYIYIYIYILLRTFTYNHMYFSIYSTCKIILLLTLYFRKCVGYGVENGTIGGCAIPGVLPGVKVAIFALLAPMTACLATLT